MEITLEHLYADQIGAFKKEVKGINPTFEVVFFHNVISRSHHNDAATTGVQ